MLYATRLEGIAGNEELHTDLRSEEDKASASTFKNSESIAEFLQKLYYYRIHVKSI